jgi:hypothetical protein
VFRLLRFPFFSASMLAGESASSPSPFDLPPWLERLYKWSKSLLILVTILGFGAACIVGKEEGWFLAWLLIVFFVVLHFIRFLIRRIVQDTDLAERALSANPAVEQEDREGTLVQLRRAKRDVMVILVFLFIVAATSTALLLYRPAYHMLMTERPISIEFESIRYLDPTYDSGLLNASPFLAAVTAYMTAEGNGEGRNTKIILGTTKPFLRPTPKFQLDVSVDDPSRVIAGYAFREHRERERVLYEPVALSYVPNGLISFSLPPCDRDDQVFFLGRLSLTDKTDSFPLDLRGAIKLSATEAHKWAIKFSPTEAHQ